MSRLALALLLALSAGACAVRYDDGAGDLWKVPACTVRGAC
ncbi:hypothetical protein [Bosea sp. (in: a-proteobacteria)]|nr:hypothetical protein [Bosea sp. (in: a-proteobacteria)]